MAGSATSPEDEEAVAAALLRFLSFLPLLLLEEALAVLEDLARLFDGGGVLWPSGIIAAELRSDDMRMFFRRWSHDHAEDRGFPAGGILR